MKKGKVLLGIVVIGAVLLSGCTGYNSRPPSGYPSRYSEGDVNIKLEYDIPIFFFGDIVQEDGSINRSKTVNWTLTINNYGKYLEDVRFEIIHFPYEIIIWATIEATIPTEFDYYDMEFDCIWIEVPSNTSMDFIFSITLDEAFPWSYNADTSYVGHFEIGYRIDRKGSVYYDELKIPFVVRT